MTQLQHADDRALHALIFDEEESASVRETARHVESCEDCLARLNQIAATDEFSVETAHWLSSHADLPQSEFEVSDRELVESSIQDCLSPPSHPEMMGRLRRYEIEKVIGSGGMGVVLKGFDSELNRPVAVKLLARHLAHNGSARQRFAREARAAAAVVHEHVVAIHNVETDGEFPFLVMQFIAGESLQTRVDREGPLDARQILRIGIQAAGGLAAAHEQGVVHRDIKPANILLEESVERVLLTDFGLARTVDDASLTQTGIVTGTPHYMSPEQATGEATDQRTDLFSLGAVLYFMATGHPPFRAERAMGVLHRICTDRHRPVWEVNPDVPDALSEVIDLLLQKKVGRRICSAVQLRERLVAILERLQRPRPVWARRIRQFVRQYHSAILGGSMMLLSAVSLAALWARDDGDSGPDTDRERIAVNNAREQATPAQESLFGSANRETYSLPPLNSEELAELESFESAEEFANDLEAMQEQLDGVSDDDSLFPGSVDDLWKTQVELLNQQLDDIEDHLSFEEPDDE